MVFRRTPATSIPRVTLEPPSDARGLLTHLYWSAVEAAAPGPALARALERVELRGRRRIWILALGKAAHPMAAAAVEWLARRGIAPAGGVIVAPTAAIPPHPSLVLAVGDHPLPGPRSFAAARAIGEIAARVGRDDEAWVLLSGGASSLAAAPDGSTKPDELVELFRLLLESGLDVARMNTIRKRFLRWGAGRLALALHPARIRNFIVSDVIGDDLNAIGSGPCVPDQNDASTVRALLEEERLWERVPVSLRRYLTSIERDGSGETPKPGDPAFFDVERGIITSNRVALEAAAARAAEYGMETRVVSASLSGPAADAGRRVANALLAYRGPAALDAGRSPRRVCLLWGGETTVHATGATGTGGRCQELALAAAMELAAAGADAAGTAILAAGTDGRDGPTDAAGAIVDGDTWSAIERAGIDPSAALAAHDSYRALDGAGALLRTGYTGTNVMDVVIAVAGIPRI